MARSTIVRFRNGNPITLDDIDANRPAMDEAMRVAKEAGMSENESKAAALLAIKIFQSLAKDLAKLGASKDSVLATLAAAREYASAYFAAEAKLSKRQP